MKDVKFEIDGKEYQLPNFMSIENYVKMYKVKDLLSDEYFAAKLINIMSDAPIDELIEVNYQHIHYLATYIMSLVPQDEQPKFYDRFQIDNVDYGFLPSWKKLSFGEFVDLDTLMNKKGNEFLDYIHILTAIMYRPIISDPTKHDYEIEKYNTDTMVKRAELFKKELDIRYFLGAQFFFTIFAKKYLQHTQSFSTTTLTLKDSIKLIWRYRKILRTLALNKDSDGTSSSTDLLKTILQDMNKSSKKPWWKFSINLPTLLKRTKK